MAHENTYKRKEMKYLLSGDEYSALKRAASAYIKPDFYSESIVNNIYLDTADFELAKRSIEKPVVYKEKLRLRSYKEAAPESSVFLELKKKYKGVVYKRRFECSLAEAVNYLQNGIKPENANQMFSEIDYSIQFYKLVPAMFISYDRLAYCGIDDEEFRITFDSNVRYRNYNLNLLSGSSGIPILDKSNILMEIKAAQAMPQWMLKILSELNIYPNSFSKYGSAYKHMLKALNTSLKENIA